MNEQEKLGSVRGEERLAHDEDGIGSGDLFSQLFCILPAYTIYVTRLCASPRIKTN